MSHPYPTSYQPTAELNQAFGPGPQHHHAPPPPPTTNIPPRTAYQEQYRLSASPQPPPGLLPYPHDPGHPEPSGSRIPSTGGFTKRKGDELSHSPGKKRLKEDEDDGDDGHGAGAKHWTDDDKAKLFNWLMAPNNDEHFNMLRSSKNNCLRECALEVFGGKKTFQALKGAFERAFVTFKQIYAFEAFTAHLRNPGMNPASQTERHRDWEKRILAARKDGFDVGSLSVRVLEQWHRTGWYQLFYNRWHGDPITTKPIVRMGQGSVPMANNAGSPEDEPNDEPEELIPEQAPPDLGERESSAALLAPPPIPPPPPQQALPPNPFVPGSISAGPSAYPSAATPSNVMPPPPPAFAPMPGLPGGPAPAYPTEQTLSVLVGLTQNMMSTYVQLLKTQAEEGKLKLEYLRRREEREEEESRLRRDHEKRRMEREQADWEYARETERVRHKTAMAQETLTNSPDPGVKAAAADYLKKLFLD